MMNVCVYGGGNIAQSIVAKISVSQPVTVITRQPARWMRRMAFEQNGTVTESSFDVQASNDVTAAATADLVFVALPQFAIQEAVDRLCRVLQRDSTVAFVPAPAMTSDIASRLADIGVHTVGFQRVPYISRFTEYGSKVRISSDRAVHRVAFSPFADAESLKIAFSRWFGGTVSTLSSFLTFAFNNSNPLLHPSRMVILFRDWRTKTFVHNPPFYAEWTDESSNLYLNSDQELLSVIKAADPSGDCLRDYEDVLTHYGVKDGKSLTEKIRSIQAFQQILSPMKLASGLWIPDFSSRYFTEDIPFGTKVIQAYARKHGVATPTIDRMIQAIETEILDPQP